MSDKYFKKIWMVKLYPSRDSSIHHIGLIFNMMKSTYFTGIVSHSLCFKFLKRKYRKFQET